MSSNQQILLDAIQNEKTTSKQGFLQKLFAVWFDAFVYNQIWEDPQIDLQALKLDEHSRVLTISSGGCNALNYLLENPQTITAVDLNRHHIFLLNLKIAALRFLPSHADFFNFFGFGKHDENERNYKNFIAPNLDENTRKFWEENSMLHGKRIDFFKKGGLYASSRNARFLGFFHRLAHLCGCRPEEILRAETFEEQEKIYQKQIAPFFDTFFMKAVGKLPVTMFGLGIPPQQYEELKKDLTADKTIIDVYRERVRRLACAFPIQENYFAWQAFARKYDTENRRAIPEYLKEKSYAPLQANINRLQTKIGSVTDEIKIQPKNAFNRFVFLDAQDWMNAETLNDLWQTIAEKGERGSRIIFRTASAHSPIETNLPNALREKFVYEKDFSEKLFTQDRASIYGGFHLYILKK
jgi:S-adenosylmethionine-diacylglycerol 3-amino-3-carboxypropyl transferase